VLQDVSAFLPGVMNYTAGEVAEQLRSTQVSADFFRCWGIRIVRGRTFTPEEDLPHGPRVTLISQNLWTRHFASDPRILGKTISLNGEPYLVIGILAGSAGLREFGPPSDVYIPFQFEPNTRDEANYFRVAARLKPGVTVELARDRLQAFANDIRFKFPNTVGQRGGFSVTVFREALEIERYSRTNDVYPTGAASGCRECLVRPHRANGLGGTNASGGSSTGASYSRAIAASDKPPCLGCFVNG
jgi:hypothetical protein